MNLFKIAIKNIKKSRKDYSVYFMTMIIAVSVFYMFNSLANQDFIKNLSDTGKGLLSLMGAIIKSLSVAAAIVLGLLMVYANNFLIKRRKKEFGVYRMLGMEKRAVSGIILRETVIVGLISLVIGIIIGIFCSQFLSVLVIRMFDSNVSDFAFSFSKEAVLMTLLSFAVIFIVVSIFNTVTVSKYRLIDLLNADKKGEKKLMKSKALSIVFVITAIAVLAVSYYRMAFDAVNLGRFRSLIYIVLGVVATFLFFIGISGFLLELFQKQKKFYFKGINSFVVRQFCSNINTGAISTAVICLMLFMALGSFSLGFSIKNTLNTEVRESTPADITLIHTEGSVTDFYKKQGYPVTEWNKEYVEIPLYKNDFLTYSSVLGNDAEEAMNRYPRVAWNTNETIIRLTDYNTVADFYGWERIELGSGQYALVCNFEQIRDLNNKTLEKNEPLMIADTAYKNAIGKCIERFLMMGGSLGIIVLPDEAIDKQYTASGNKVEESHPLFADAGTFFAGKYKSEEKGENLVINEKVNMLMGDLGKYRFDSEDNYESPVMEAVTKIEIMESNSGISVFFVVTALYIGIVFVVSSAAILALKVLSDSIDSVKKYEILKKIGTDKSLMKTALLKHVLLCFAAPMALAIIHTVFGLMFAGSLLNGLGMGHLFTGVISTFVVMILIYGGYMMLTYFGALRVTNIE